MPFRESMGFDFTQTLKLQGKIENNLIAIYLGGNDNKIQFGNYDSEILTTEIRYFKNNKSDYWSPNLSTLYFEGIRMDINQTKIFTIIDISNAKIVLPFDYFN